MKNIKNISKSILLFLAKEPRAEVMNDLSVSLTSISSLDENKLNKEGNNKNVINNETIVLDIGLTKYCEEIKGDSYECD